MNKIAIMLAASAMIFGTVACGESTDDTKKVEDTKTGPGGKGDTPNDKDYDGVKACEDREKDMVFSARRAFTPESIRWAVADVEGVNANNRDDRGQEYTEYFVAVRDIDGENQELKEEVGLYGTTKNGSNIELVLNDDQVEWLEDNDREENVGVCVFTSWHRDMPALECESNDSCPTLLGNVKVGIEPMRMKTGFNSNGAARDLIGQCANLAGGTADIGGGQKVSGTPALVNGDVEDADDPLNRDFMRGCLRVDSMFSTGWRRSDSSVCAASMRLAECGCSVGGATDLAGIVSNILPSEDQQIAKDGKLTIRGFKLGSWKSTGDLPTGCEYIKTENGDDLDTMVRCGLNATEVLDNAKDLKEYCRNKYSNDITVNVPINAEAVSCTPPEGGQYSASCGEQPWVINYSSRADQ